MLYIYVWKRKKYNSVVLKQILREWKKKQSERKKEEKEKKLHFAYMKSERKICRSGIVVNCTYE